MNLDNPTGFAVEVKFKTTIRHVLSPPVIAASHPRPTASRLIPVSTPSPRSHKTKEFGIQSVQGRTLASRLPNVVEDPFVIYKCLVYEMVSHRNELKHCRMIYTINGDFDPQIPP